MTKEQTLANLVRRMTIAVEAIDIVLGESYAIKNPDLIAAIFEETKMVSDEEPKKLKPYAHDGRNFLRGGQ